ncbi:tyrosine-tRNA ligase [Edhazardia aedis USNM 41457]|uniref:Tyrosine--tRNA ligase n=1 Tax=Edhazardia aedis (strain USNM 41457) TaxID=1003232 RepID=J9DQN9_EDHAE|nr:tyrosine-tRNA ligase [Edhazardia aedis USNM 41457]|eukprot:EJW04880.1 tyrosine-tRNA ligase [Edhazardia aedis USNM 41457]
MEDSAYDLITRNLQEVIGEDELRDILSNRQLNVYWGTATTGKPHIAYFLPILKIRDFLKANCHVKILLADIHAFLDNLKAPFEQIEARTIYYENVIKAMLKSIGIDCNERLTENNNSDGTKELNLEKKTKMKLEFVKGSTFQCSTNYTMDLYKISTLTSERDAKKAGAQVVKQVSNPLLSSMIYPSMQALDEEYLDVDAQFGGVDQRKIFTYAMKYLPLLGYKKRIHLMNPMIPGLNSDKMSSSDEFSKIDLLDSEKSIKNKIRKCFCAEGNKETGILYLVKHIVFPIFEIKNIEVVINRKDMDALVFKNYEDLENAFVENEIHPSDLKDSVADMIELIIKPVREEMSKNIELVDKAYGLLKKKKKK